MSGFGFADDNGVCAVEFICSRKMKWVDWDRAEESRVRECLWKTFSGGPGCCNRSAGLNTIYIDENYKVLT
jgi:hypothetical protein